MITVLLCLVYLMGRTASGFLLVAWVKTPLLELNGISMDA